MAPKAGHGPARFNYCRYCGMVDPEGERGGISVSMLNRYARRFGGVEINSTFYRSHKASTYAWWRDSVSEDFLFVVKLPKAISHEKCLS